MTLSKWFPLGYAGMGQLGSSLTMAVGTTDLEEKAMHLEIDKRAKKQIINMLKDDRETLFAQLSNHVRTITDQARIIGQLETRLELGPGRAVKEQPKPVERPPVREPERPAQTYRPPELVNSYEPARMVEERRDPAPANQEPVIEYPPRYGGYSAQGQGDNRAPVPLSPGVQ